MNAVITNDSAALTASTGSRQQAPRNLAPAVCAITTDNTFFLRGSSHVIPQVRVLRPVGLQPLSRDGSVSVAVLSALAGDASKSNGVDSPLCSPSARASRSTRRRVSWTVGRGGRGWRIECPSHVD
jgi:hypothetical protein